MSAVVLQKILVDGICLFLLVFSYVNIRRNKRYHFPLANGFILCNVSAVLFEIAATVAESGAQRSTALLYLLENGYNCSALAATGCWFLNSLQVTKSRAFAKRKYLVLLMLPLAFALLLTLTTPWHHRVFFFEGAGQYVRGNWFVSFFSIAGVYLVCALVQYIRAELRKDVYIFKNLNMVSAAYTVFLLVCMGIQVMTKDAMSVINAACALTALMIHEDLQKKEITMDPLTELKNRNAINENILRILKSEKENRYAIMLDIDLFKQINDRYGHLEGDHALVSVANVLRQEFGRNVFFGRYGGDEFLILSDELGKEEIGSTEERLNARLCKEQERNGKEYRIEVSAGIVAVDDTMDTIPDVIRRADEQLYFRKRAKKAEREKR